MKTRTLLLTAACIAATCPPFLVSSADNPAQPQAQPAQRPLAQLNDPAPSKAGEPASEAVSPRPDTEAQARARQALRDEAVTPASAAEGFNRTQATGPSKDSEVQAKAREAVRTTGGKKPVARKQSPNPLLEGMTPPQSPFTAEQQAALAALLEPYLANQLSTADYHQKRADIIAGR